MSIQLHAHVGKLKGSFKNKDNRTAKLLQNWSDIRMQMERFVEAGHGITLRARAAYGILLMMETGIRIGNETSAEGYVCDQKHHESYGKKIQVYGLTTLRMEHTRQTVTGKIILEFLGKKAVHQTLHTSHPLLRKYYHIIASQSRSLGYQTWLGVDYGDIYRFVKQSIGRKFKPKDIRTAAVNLLFLRKAESTGIMSRPFDSKSGAGRALKMVVDATAQEIGHTPGVCRGAYLSRSLQSVIKEKLYEGVRRRREAAVARRRR